MPLSRYCVLFPGLHRPGATVLFSTKRSSIVEVPSALVDDIHRGTLPAGEKELLARLGFLVADGGGEEREMTGFMKELDLLRRSLGVTLLFTRDCNLDCPYCFEGSRKGRLSMSRATADLFTAFVQERLLPARDGLRLTCYGGEPLLCREMIVYLAGRLKEAVEGAAKDFSLSLVTNGTLLTPGAVEELRPLGLAAAAVTLDGPREVHDAARPFRSGRGSYEVIVGNLEKVCAHVDVQVGGNFTRDNYRQFPRLLDDLAARGLTPERISQVSFDPVTRESGEFARPDFHGGCADVNEPWLAEAVVFLREEVLRRGYRTRRIMPAACMIELSGEFVVDCDGSLYKCPCFIGRGGLAAGHVAAGLGGYGETHALANWKNDRCLGCAYLPLCFGGCRNAVLVRDGRMGGVECRKDFYDAALAALVEQDIRYGLAPPPPGGAGQATAPGPGAGGRGRATAPRPRRAP